MISSRATISRCWMAVSTVKMKSDSGSAAPAVWPCLHCWEGLGMRGCSS